MLVILNSITSSSSSVRLRQPEVLLVLKQQGEACGHLILLRMLGVVWGDAADATCEVSNI